MANRTYDIGGVWTGMDYHTVRNLIERQWGPDTFGDCFPTKGVMRVTGPKELDAAPIIEEGYRVSEPL